MHKFIKVAKAGGVNKSTSSRWDEDAELDAAVKLCLIELLHDLVTGGHVTMSAKYYDGDYVKRRLELSLPEPALA